MENPELAVIGLTCSVVGVFFLANSIRFREPRKALQDALGVGVRSLLRVRDTALNNMQVIIGFLFLTTGFLLQVVAKWDQQWTTLAFCAGIIVFAGLIYAVSVISIPMILHRQTDAITAGLTSLRLVLTQTGVMLWWGFLITAIVVLAMLPWFAGLLLAGPVIGHASWHAYRAAVA